MPKLKTKDIAKEVRDILANAAPGREGDMAWLTAYQILERLPAALRRRLVDERGMPGKGGGVHYSAASLVSDTAETLDEIEIGYFDANGATFKVGRRKFEPGYPVLGLYRLG